MTTDEQSFDREKDQFTRIYSRDLGIEKSDPNVVDFPSSGPIPTYAVAFGTATKASRPQSDVFSEYSDEIGSPLHDPSFSDVEKGSSHATSKYSQNGSLPPRFRANPSVLQASSDGSLSMHTNYLATIHQNVDIGRADSATSSEAESNPFSLDIDKRSSMSSGSSKGQGPHKSYVTAGSHHVPTITTMHVKQGGQVRWEAKKNWVIE